MKMHRLKTFISTFPLFILLLPAFFVMHGYIENYNFVPLGEAVLLILFYIGVSAVILLLSWFFFRNLINAAIFTVCIMSFQFFFGSVFDQLKQNFQGSFVAKYSFILPVSFILLILLLKLLKRRKKPLTNLVAYLNLLLIIFIAADLVLFIPKYLSLQKRNRQIFFTDSFSTCDTCSKPDIYLIIADEYAGNTELTSLLNFDNSPFLDSLEKRGFNIMRKGHSNYTSTVSSMASFFEMNYLYPGNKDQMQEPGNEGFNVFRNNLALRFLKKQGYTIINNSIFDIDGIKGVQLDFLPRQTALITFHTFTTRIWHDMGYHFASNFKIPFLTDKYLYTTLRTTNKMVEKIRVEATRSAKNPRFIYTHLNMPHFPFYFHKDGTPFPPESLREELQVIKENYVDYLQYSNTKYLSLIDHILTASKKPPVILFLSDHGYRHFRNVDNVDKKYKYMNLMSIYLPGKQYDTIPDSLCNVNYLRNFFNAQFNQNFRMIADSIFIEVKDTQSNKFNIRAQKWE